MHDVGFFYLAGHGVPQELTDAILDVSRRFFDLPEEQKLAVENVFSAQFRGYTRVGGELTDGAVDWREQIDIGVERGAVQPGPGVPDYWRLEGPNLWPDALPEMREIVSEWTERLSTISLTLLRAVAVSLGAAEDTFDEAFAARAFPLLKIVRYPGESDPEPKQGVGSHRDGGVLTLLLVEPGKGGLQVEHEGRWIDAPQVPGTFVVNIGEMLELATNGYLKATLHRVISPLAGHRPDFAPLLLQSGLGCHHAAAGGEPGSFRPRPAACRSTRPTAPSWKPTATMPSATGCGPTRMSLRHITQTCCTADGRAVRLLPARPAGVRFVVPILLDPCSEFCKRHEAVVVDVALVLFLCLAHDGNSTPGP